MRAQERLRPHSNYTRRQTNITRADERDVTPDSLLSRGRTCRPGSPLVHSFYLLKKPRPLLPSIHEHNLANPLPTVERTIEELSRRIVGKSRIDATGDPPRCVVGQSTIEIFTQA